MYVCVYIYMMLSDRFVRDHDCFMLMFICTFISMLLSEKVFRDHSCGRIISYAGEWNEVVPFIMRNRVARVVLTNL